MGCGAGAGVGVATPVLTEASVIGSDLCTSTSKGMHMLTEKWHALPFHTALPQNAKFDTQTAPVRACSKAPYLTAILVLTQQVHQLLSLEAIALPIIGGTGGGIFGPCPL